MGALHLGTDGGGSIRIPAAFTGIFGLKPSFGRVPVYPPSAVRHDLACRPDDAHRGGRCAHAHGAVGPGRARLARPAPGSVRLPHGRCTTASLACASPTARRSVTRRWTPRSLRSYTERFDGSRSSARRRARGARHRGPRRDLPQALVCGRRARGVRHPAVEARAHGSWPGRDRRGRRAPRPHGLHARGRRARAARRCG